MNLLLLALLFLCIAVIATLIIRRWPDYAFWLILLLLFDPSGHFSVYLGKDSLGGFYYRDFLFVLAFIPLFTKEIEVRKLLSFRPFLIIIGVQLLFLLYHIFVFGYFQTEKGWDYLLRYVLIRERMSVFGFMLIIPVFVMARRRLSFLVDILVISTIIVYAAYFITLLSNAELVPVWQAERYRGTGILRYSLYSSGLTDMLVPLAIFIFVRKVPYRYSKLLYASVAMVIMAVILSLTKSTYINFAGLVVASLFLYYRIYKPSVQGLLFMLAGPALLLLFVTWIVFPDYPGLAWRQVQDIWLFITCDAYTSGVVEGRLENQWPAHLALIRERPFFGTGAAFSDFFSMRFDVSDYEVTDLPITGHLAMYGVVGLAIYSLFYIQFWRYLMVGFHNIKNHITQTNEPNIAFFFVVFAWLVKTFFFKPNYLFNELTTGTLLINVYAGLLLAILYRQQKT
jgi:O-antigen ligase